MQITKPTYIVVELPVTVAEWVRSTRVTFEPAIAHLPAEITLTGSSGVGPMKRGQSLALIETCLKSALFGQLPFESCFLDVNCFPGTDIFFASPERARFDTLHASIVASGIEFEPSPYPYNPHCSLKGYTPLQPGQRKLIESLAFPKHRFVMNEIAIYEMAGMTPKKLSSITA